MLEFLNRRASISQRLGLIGACLAPPIILLLVLFVSDVVNEIRSARKELTGVAILETIWPQLSGERTGLARSKDLGLIGARTAKAAKAFAGSDPAGRPAAGATLMRAVADDSGLTLDIELDSFYAQQGASVALPKLMAATASLARAAPGPQQAAAALTARELAGDAVDTLNTTIADDPSGLAAGRLRPRVAEIEAAAKAVTMSGRPPSILADSVDRAWRTDSAELRRMLQARIARLKRTLVINLCFAASSFGLAGLLMIAMAKGLTGRLRGLLATMDRLNARDTAAPVPFQSDQNETGRIAAMLVAFKQGLEAQRESRAQLRSVNRAMTAYVRSISALLHSADLESVAAGVCQAIVEDGAYPLAMVALTEPAPNKSLRVVASAGDAAAYGDGLKLSWSEDEPEGNGPTGLAIRSGAPQVLKDTLDAPVFAPWRERAEPFGIRSSVTVPFSTEGAIRGVLIVYALRPNAFDVEEMALFGRLGEELAFAIELEAGRRRLAQSLQAKQLAEEAEKLSQRRLEESEARFRMLAEEASDIIIRYDQGGVIEYVSPSVAQLGYRPEDWIGHVIGEFGHPDDQASRRSVRAELFAGRPLPANVRNESRVRRADGVWRWVEGRPSVVRDEMGQAIAVISFLRDVTERHEMEDELRRKQAEAEAAARAKAQFLANMSHEIRTPLTGVIGFAGLLERMSDLPDTAQRYVQRIVGGGRALLSLVDDILDVSRIEAGRVEIAPQPLEILPFLEEAVALISPEAEKKGLEIRIDPLGQPVGWISVDAARLRQVLLNLIGNAIKFTPQGVITIGLSYWAAGGGFLRLSVKDTGLGIAPDQVGRLFERFSQADESNTRQYGGAGLGLAIAKGLVEMMGGEIGVESAPGQGSTFWFTVSAPPVDAPAEAPDREEDPAGLSPMRILVVDDVATNRELVLTMLSPFDLEVVEAADGAEAVAAADRSRFDLILMDLQMPRMDGLAATRLIRSKSIRNRGTPILAVSANVLPEHVAACHDAGMNDHIGKPINPQDLLSKIDRWTAEAD